MQNVLLAEPTEHAIAGVARGRVKLADETLKALRSSALVPHGRRLSDQQRSRRKDSTFVRPAGALWANAVWLCPNSSLSLHNAFLADVPNIWMG